MTAPKSIELGLSRITRLLNHQPPFPWPAIHVAGTNGKGSICALASTLLRAAGLRCGRFTSPHLLDRWDCITIDERPVKKSLFQTIEAEVQARDRALSIRATPFELLTATAFDVFSREAVEAAVVEVGVGGRLDATNVLRPEQCLVSVIAKVGLDHQALLGDSLAKIAREKAGILKRGVPCVVDGTNDPVVLDVVAETAEAVGAGPVISRTGSVSEDPEIWKVLSQADFEPHQRTNLSCALKAVEIALGRLPQWRLQQPSDFSKAVTTDATANTNTNGNGKVNVHKLLPALKNFTFRGRLQTIDIGPLTGRSGQNVLLDGAHNLQAAEALSQYINKRLRRDFEPSTVEWVLASSRGKADVSNMLAAFLKPRDHVLAVEFGPVDGMPWVQPMGSAELADIAREAAPEVTAVDCGNDILQALRQAAVRADGGPLVIAGSLYLVSDVFRLLRGSGDS